MASPAYIRALEEIKIYDVAQYEVPLFLRQDDTFGCVDDLPLKHLAAQTEAKSFLDIIKDAPLDNVDFGLLEEHMLQNKYDDLPAPFAPKVPLHKSYKMQIAIMKSSMTHCVVLKQFIFPEKTSLRNVNEIAHGTVYLLDYTPNYRVGPLAVQCMLKKMSHWFAHYTQLTPKVPTKDNKPKQDQNDLRVGFDYIRAQGPKTNVNNQQTEWAEIETHRSDSPLNGWSAGLVKECLRSLSTGNVHAKPDHKFPLTLHDIAGWFLGDVLIHILGDLRSKTIVFMGLAEKGKTPIAQAIAMCFSEYLILKDGMESEYSPGFRICSSLDQLRGESGLKYRPDILDDGDSSSIPVTKLKSFLDSSLVETHTVERWTAARFVKGQLRILCDNKVDEDAPEGAMSVKFETFMEMTAPAFPEKASSQDKMACYKRAHWVVNMPGAVYLRPAGTSKDDVRRIPYIGGVTDFISPEGHEILGRLYDGITEPPENWATKRQWSLDLMAMLCESGKKPPRTQVISRSSGSSDRREIQIQREIKPKLPFSGYVSPDFVPKTDANSSSAVVPDIDNNRYSSPKPNRVSAAEASLSQPKLVQVKQELEDVPRFRMLLSAPDKIINLDSPSPPPHKRLRSQNTQDVADEMDVEDEDVLPCVGEKPGE